MLSIAWTGIGFSDGSSSPQDLTTSSFPIGALLDSGTTASIIPDDLASSIQSGLGVIQDPTFGPLLPCSAGDDNTQGFTFTLGGSDGASITVPLNELLYPQADANGDPLTFDDGTAACMFALQGGADEAGLAILGDAFLRSAYVVYDLDNNQISLAQTVFNATDSPNIVDISGQGALPSASAPASTITASAVALSKTLPGGVTGETRTAGSVTGSASLGGFTGSATFRFNPTGTGGSHTAGGAASTSSHSAANPGVRYGGVDSAAVVAVVVAGLGVMGGMAWVLY